MAMRPAMFRSLGKRFFSTEAAYKDTLTKAGAAYQSSKASLDGFFDQTLKENKMVLFMEGTPDAPKSELGLNVVKMLTQVQAVPLKSVDVMTHPAILGYASSKAKAGTRFPHLYVDGSFYADHDALLQKYNSGELKKIGTSSTLSNTPMSKGDLPVATY